MVIYADEAFTQADTQADDYTGLSIERRRIIRDDVERFVMRLAIIGRIDATHIRVPIHPPEVTDYYCHRTEPENEMQHNINITIDDSGKIVSSSEALYQDRK